jgi:hypothetical protein
MFTALRCYPRYFLWTLINAVFFCIVYIICFGLPNFSSAPILHLVWLILVNYWIAIVLPSLVLMEELSINPWKAIIKSYQHFQVCPLEYLFTCFSVSCIECPWLSYFLVTVIS